MYLTKEELFSKFYFKSSEKEQKCSSIIYAFGIYKAREEPPLLALHNSILLATMISVLNIFLKEIFHNIRRP